jgi:hypothetical protein
MEEDPPPVAPHGRPATGNQPDQEAGPSQVRLPGLKRKLVLTAEEEEPEGPETTPRKDKGPARNKTTPLNKCPKEVGDDGEEIGEEGDPEQGPPMREEPEQEAGPSGGA